MVTVVTRGFRGKGTYGDIPDKGCGIKGLMTFLMLGNYTEDEGAVERFISLVNGKSRVLQDKIRDVLLKRIIDGKNLDETAAEMSLTREAVRQKLRDAVVMLYRRCWDDYIINGKSLGNDEGPTLIDLLNQGVLNTTAVNSLLSIGYRNLSDLKAGGYGRLLYAERIGKPTMAKIVELTGMKPEDMRLKPDMNLRLANKHGIKDSDVAYVLYCAGCETLDDAVAAGESRVKMARGCGEKRRADLRRIILEYCGEDAYDRYVGDKGSGQR